MTLVTGTVQDLGYDGMEGTLWARPARFRSDGSVVYAPERKPFTITGGVVSAELAPGPAVLELQVGSHARGTFEVVIPDTDITLADLLDTVFPWEPAQVSQFVAERELAVQAKTAAETAAGQASTAAGTATTAAQQTGQDRTAVAADKQVVVGHVQALAAPNDAAVLGLISEGATTQTKAALNATYRLRAETPMQSVKDFGAVCDGTTDDTDAIKAAVAGVKKGYGLWFPGKCAVSDTIVVPRSIPMAGDIGLESGLVARNLPADKDLLVFTTQWLMSWHMKHMLVDASAGGRHALRFPGGWFHQVFFAEILGCSLIGGPNGAAIYSDRQMAYSRIVGNVIQGRSPEWGGINLEQCADGMTIRDNTMSGSGFGITLNLRAGVRNYTIDGNIMFPDGGHVWIKNGQNVRITNNQMESVPGATNSHKAMIVIEGNVPMFHEESPSVERRFPADQCIIHGNNLSAQNQLNPGVSGSPGGFDHAIKIMSGRKASISANQFISGNAEEIVILPDVHFTHIADDNMAKTGVTNRSSHFMPIRVKDQGQGTTGLYHRDKIAWSPGCYLEGSFLRDTSGRISQIGTIEGAPTTAGDVICTLPWSLRPAGGRVILPATTQGGSGTVRIDVDGAVSVVQLPSGSRVQLGPWPAGSTDNRPMKPLTDTFDRADSTTELGITDTGDPWRIHTPATTQYGIESGEAYRVAGYDWPWLETGSKDQMVTGILKGTGYMEIAARYDSDAMYYGVRAAPDQSNMALFSRMNGVSTQVSADIPWASGDQLRIWVKDEVDATRVLLYRKAVSATSWIEVASFYDTTPTRPSGTKAAFRLQEGGGRIGLFAVESA